MVKFKLNVVTSLVSMALVLSAQSASATQDEDVLPKARSGECYAKVLVPPVYKTESVEVVVSEASEELQIIPSVYSSSTERVQIKEASTRLTTIDPVYETVKKRVQTAAAESRWVRDSLKGTIGVGAGTLADIAASGFDVAGAEPGVCLYEHYKPASYKTVGEKVMISAASEELSVEEANFSTSEKQVLVKAASKRLVEVPAVFKSVPDKVLIEPAKSVWKKGTGPIMKIDHATGEIMCLVDLPPVYEEYTRRAVAAPPLTTSVVIPAEFETVEIESLRTDAKEVRTPVPAKFTTVDKSEKVSEDKIRWIANANGNESVHGEQTGNVVCFQETPAKFETVEQKLVKTPGSFKSVAVPAVFKNVPIQKLVSDATVKKSPIAQVKKSFIKRVKVSDASLQWRPVLCDTNMTDHTILDIQEALADKGYNPGLIDGVLGKGTLDALEKFQKEKNLAQGGITYATLDALGVEL